MNLPGFDGSGVVQVIESWVAIGKPAVSAAQVDPAGTWSVTFTEPFVIGPAAPGTAGKFWQFSSVPENRNFVGLVEGVAVSPRAILSVPLFFGGFGVAPAADGLWVVYG